MLQFQDQNCDGYTRTALMGNWYEDREAIEQKFNLERDFREVLLQINFNKKYENKYNIKFCVEKTQ